MRLDSSLFLPFAPKKEKFFKKNGKLLNEFEICFHVYVFIESELSSDEFFIEIIPNIRMIDEIYRIVSYSDKGDIAMRANEISSLKSLYEINYCIGNSVGYIEGDIVKVNSGPLVGKESIIRKINRHKREAIIEIEFMGYMRQINVGLEIIIKI